MLTPPEQLVGSPGSSTGVGLPAWAEQRQQQRLVGARVPFANLKGGWTKVMGREKTVVEPDFAVKSVTARPAEMLWTTSYATGVRVTKGEDAMLAAPLPGHPQVTLFMVCDGHSGVEAAQYVTTHIPEMLSAHLLQLPADMTDAQAVEDYAADVRRLICECLVSVEADWSELGHLAGTTVTLLLVCGSLLTVANLGDSSCVLDTGCSLLELSHSHRVQDNLGERTRIMDAGRQVAHLGFHLQGPARPGEPGVGPLRIWPGGLCVSRSIGDLDVGPEVVPLPHIKQLLAPAAGCRIILSSDGLWDVMTLSRAVKLTRHKPLTAAATALIDAVLRDQRFLDDTSLFVVDVLPQGAAGRTQITFPDVALQMGLASSIQPVPRPIGGMCGCFCSPPEPEERCARLTDPGGPGYVTVLADVDCLLAFPELRYNVLSAPDIRARQGRRTSSPRPRELTLHNGDAYLQLEAAGKVGGHGTALPGVLRSERAPDPPVCDSAHGATPLVMALSLTATTSVRTPRVSRQCTLEVLEAMEVLEDTELVTEEMSTRNFVTCRPNGPADSSPSSPCQGA